MSSLRLKSLGSWLHSPANKSSNIHIPIRLSSIFKTKSLLENPGKILGKHIFEESDTKKKWAKGNPFQIWLYFGLTIHSSNLPLSKKVPPFTSSITLCPGRHRRKGRQHRDHRNLTSCHFQNDEFHEEWNKTLLFFLSWTNHFIGRFDFMNFAFLWVEMKGMMKTMAMIVENKREVVFGWFHDLIEKHPFCRERL